MKTHIEESIGNRVLSRAQQQDTYVLSLAKTNEEVRAAQTLRFLVFNLELNEGLEQSYSTCLDADPFDEVCDHLLVKETETGEIVGTYRLQTGPTAGQKLGYYSEQEFRFEPYEPIRSQIVELGRACVHRHHRNLAVLSLLWTGISVYCRQRGGRYLIGCSSLTSQDPTVGAAVYSDLCRRHLVEERFQTRPTAAYDCPLDQMSREKIKVPKLLSAYLSLGAKICGAPAIDREFKTIDFLTFLDLAALPEKTVTRYLSGSIDRL
jgi:putative hemolysin